MDYTDPFSYLFKFLIIGSAGSGKTCILRRLTEGKFIPNMPHTIGAEFGSIIMNADGTAVKLHIWDTAGQERFKSLAHSYYHQAVGALLVYDVTNRDSFNEIGSWLSDARDLASPEISVVLVANKKDLQDTSGQVTHTEGNSFAEENDLHFIETSALTGENVEEAFLQCSRVILSKIKTGELDSTSLSYGRHRGIRSGPTVVDRPVPLGGSPSSYTNTHYDCQC